MSWFSLKKAMGTNYSVDPGDIVNTKKALSQLGYYDTPSHRGLDDWTDDAMFDGIRTFQKDNALKIDGFMRPGGPTESKINQQLAVNRLTSGGNDETERSPQYVCTVCGAFHGGVYSPTVCHNCFLK